MATLTSTTKVLAHLGAQQQNTQKPRRAPAVPKTLGVGLLANGAAALPALADPAAPFGGSGAASLPSLLDVSLPDLSLPDLSLPNVEVPDLSGLSLESVDPLVLAGGAAALAVVGLATLLGGGGGGAKAKPVPAPTALQALEADPSVLLLDVRSKAEVNETGSPNLKGISKRGPVALPYTRLVKGEVQVDEEFGARVARLRGVEAEGKPIILLDSDGAVAPAAAKAIIEELPGKKIFYVAGGAAGWQESGCPWKEPLRFALPDLSGLDLSNISLDPSKAVNAVVGGAQKLTDEFNEAPTVTKGLLAAAGVAGAGVFLFSQAELLFEVAGIFAAGQFLVKMLFASSEDREKTLTEFRKVAQEVDLPDLPEDLSKIASKLVEDPTAASGTQVLRAGAASSNGSGTPPPPPAGSSAAEAEAWIAAWRAKQGEGSTGTVAKQAQLAGDGNK